MFEYHPIRIDLQRRKKKRRAKKGEEVKMSQKKTKRKKYASKPHLVVCGGVFRISSRLVAGVAECLVVCFFVLNERRQLGL